VIFIGFRAGRRLGRDVCIDERIILMWILEKWFIKI
jgi:hypothetical protein